MKILQINCVYAYGSTGKIVEGITKHCLSKNDEVMVLYGRQGNSDLTNVIKVSSEFEAKIRAIHWGYWNRAVLKSVCSFSVWVTIIQLAQRCIFNIAPSILAAFTTSTAITILGIAICLEGYTFSFANAINGMFLPRVSRLLANNDRLEILNLMIRIGRIQIYIIGLMCIGFICVGRDFISVWLGEGYEDVYVCALLIILPSLFHLPQEIGNTTIVAEGKVKL